MTIDALVTMNKALVLPHFPYCTAVTALGLLHLQHELLLAQATKLEVLMSLKLCSGNQLIVF